MGLQLDYAAVMGNLLPENHIRLAAARLALLCLVFGVDPVSLQPAQPHAPTRLVGTVTHVADGDTFRLRASDNVQLRVRLAIGALTNAALPTEAELSRLNSCRRAHNDDRAAGRYRQRPVPTRCARHARGGC